MLSCASCAERFFDADLIKHSTLPSFESCSDWENAIGGGLLNASHDDGSDDGDDGDGGDDDMLVLRSKRRQNIDFNRNTSLRSLHALATRTYLVLTCDDDDDDMLVD